MFKNLGNLTAILKQAQQMGGRMQELQENLKKQRVIGRSGADMVEVEADGLGQILRVSLDPGLVQRGDREMIEDLLPAAINQAQLKAKQLHADAMRELTGGLNIPQLDELMTQIEPQ